MGEGCPGKGRGFGHLLRVVPGVSSQQRSAAGEEVLSPEREVVQRGQVSTAYWERRAGVQGLDLSPGRIRKQSGQLPALPCPPGYDASPPEMREQPQSTS